MPSACSDLCWRLEPGVRGVGVYGQRECTQRVVFQVGCKQNFHVYIFVLVLPISRVVCGPFIDFSVLIARD